MSTPYDRPKVTDPETVALWAAYEAANRRAAAQYAAMPSSFRRPGTAQEES